ncbi:uncharacterized protein MONBRDRAFT_25725 [Monosiga brevicollis MX1]|uniref:Uncharacterized protein n=1 Tax=Monosiga brevicollis TaxID=81824 RepID=A9V089_MONBE|nr:uncharacterized protein MONBRDRAFT_25725 [Monosiga brevicollis MX1]EDQ88968.1 predicted protein [Monosiga brevicollis MX1]|eukprot:XP_001746073.1 hypothetical protein [Monosiga brevicollis MX1]
MDTREDRADASATSTTATTVSASSFCQQISPEEYARQSQEYTRNAIEALKQSSEYMAYLYRCHHCGSVWYHGQYNPGCVQCGDGAMIRPCPICNSRCGAVFTRDAEMSHSFNKAHWNGNCRLPREEQFRLLLPSMDELCAELDDTV